VKAHLRYAGIIRLNSCNKLLLLIESLIATMVTNATFGGLSPYSRAHFYLCNKEMGLIDLKSDAGLCMKCFRYGTEAWARMEVCVKLIYAVINPQRKKSVDQINKFCSYFTRGGPIYQSLAQTNVCFDWCC
jgi:hypothetical protein